MIIRRRHNGAFTTIGNGAINDDRLSYEALGLLAYLLSKPNDWEVRLSQLRRRAGIGRDKMRRIVGELVEFGYVLRKKIRDAVSGAFVGDEYLVFDEPQNVSEEGVEPVILSVEPGPENPALGEPGPGYPAPEKASLAYKEESTKDGEEPTPDSTKVEREGARATPEPTAKVENDPRPWERDDQFMRSVKAWGIIDSLANAWREWSPLEQPVRDEAERKIPVYQAMHAQRSKRIAFSTYLRERTFTTLPEPKADGSARQESLSIERFTKDFWVIFHRRRAAPPYARDARTGRLLNDLAGQMLSFARQHRYGPSVNLHDAPTDAERGELVSVEVGSEAFRAWARVLREQHLDIRSEEVAGKRVFMPSEWPPGHEPGKALSVEDELQSEDMR